MAAKKLHTLDLSRSNLQLPHVGNPNGIATISIGAVVIDHAHWMTLQEAYKSADEALYQAKTGGRNRSVVQPYDAA